MCDDFCIEGVDDADVADYVAEGNVAGGLSLGVPSTSRVVAEVAIVPQTVQRQQTQSRTRAPQTNNNRRAAVTDDRRAPATSNRRAPTTNSRRGRNAAIVAAPLESESLSDDSEDILIASNMRRNRNAPPPQFQGISDSSDDSDDIPISVLMARNIEPYVAVSSAPTVQPLTPSTRCLVCFDAKCTMIMDPCGHFNVCKPCFKRIAKNEKNKHEYRLREWRSLRDALMESDSDFEDADAIFTEPEPVYTVRCVECNDAVAKAIVVFQN